MNRKLQVTQLLNKRVIFFLTFILCQSQGNIDFDWSYSPNSIFSWTNYLLSKPVIVKNDIYVASYSDDNELNLITLDKNNGTKLTEVFIANNVYDSFGKPQIEYRDSLIEILYISNENSSLYINICQIGSTNKQSYFKYKVTEEQLGYEQSSFGFLANGAFYLKGLAINVFRIANNRITTEKISIETNYFSKLYPVANLVIGIETRDNNKMYLFAIDNESYNRVWDYEITSNVSIYNEAAISISEQYILINFRKLHLLNFNGERIVFLNQTFDRADVSGNSILAYSRNVSTDSVISYFFEYNIQKKEIAWDLRIKENDYKYRIIDLKYFKYNAIVITKKDIMIINESEADIKKLNYSPSLYRGIRMSYFFVDDKSLFVCDNYDGIRKITFSTN